MSPSIADPTQLGERPTAGRLTGLSPSEADRGERALWLSGDGHRAALFHLGALTRLNELGLLAGLGTIGAASGGSIAAAVLATRVEWPLEGSCSDWDVRVAEPLREISAGAFEAIRTGQRRPPFPGIAGEAALEERFARELLADAADRPGRSPSFVFGAPGLALSGIGAEHDGDLEWDIAGVAPAGYERELVTETIAGLHTNLGGFEDGARAVLENHGYLLADAAARAQAIGAGAAPAQVPHPEWMDADYVRASLAGTTSQHRLRRLHLRRRGEAAEGRERAG